MVCCIFCTAKLSNKARATSNTANKAIIKEDIDKEEIHRESKNENERKKNKIHTLYFTAK